MAQLFTDNAFTTLASNVAIGDTAINITSSSSFPVISTVGDYFYATLANGSPGSIWEIVKVTATSGTSFTVVRAQDNTVAQAWGSTTSVFEVRMTAQALRDITILANQYSVAMSIALS